MPRYLLLAYDNPADFAELSPEEMQSVIERYVAWTDGVRRSGKLLASDKLVDGQGRRLSRRNGELVVRDGPFVESKEVLGGYWLIEAADLDDAARIAAGCPHTDNGILEVRAIEEME